MPVLEHGLLDCAYMLKSNAILDYLGCSLERADFDAFLKEHRIYERPHYPDVDGEEEDEQDSAFESARRSLVDEVERDSVSLIYETRDEYERLFNVDAVAGDFVLKEVAFYAPGIRHLRGFKEALPFDLLFSDDRSNVLGKLGLPVAQRTIHGLSSDRFISRDWNIDVSYLDGGASVGIVHVRRPHIFDLRMIGSAEGERDVRAVELEALISCLGRSAYDDELETLLDPLGWRSADFEMADCDEVPNLIRRYGLALYYRDNTRFPLLSGKRFPRDGAVFAGFRVNRRGDLKSQGYGGLLPFGVEFHHTPEQVKERVGRDPDWVSIGEDTGAFKWKLAHHTFHVMFSLIDYQVYRVSCFAKFMEKELFDRM